MCQALLPLVVPRTLTWNGNAFTDMGTLPLTAHGGAESVTSPVMTVDACGRVVVAFSEAEAGGDRSVHVYRFYE